MGGDEGKPHPFFQKPRLRVLNKRSASVKRPEISVTLDDETLISLRLWKEGLGTPREVLALPVDEVLTAWAYVKFRDEYEETAAELNKIET